MTQPTDPLDLNISDPAWFAVKDRIGPDEQILWLGRPHDDLRRVWLYLIPGAILTAVGVVAFFLLNDWHAAFVEGKFGTRYWLIAWPNLVSFALGGVGVYLLRTPARRRRAPLQFVYVITDRRVYLADGMSEDRPVQTVDLTAIERITPPFDAPIGDLELVVGQPIGDRVTLTRIANPGDVKDVLEDLLAARAPARRFNRCLRCNYDLTGNPSSRCPECGMVVGRPSGAAE